MIKDNFACDKLNKELNLFEIKAEINSVLSKLKGIKDPENYEIHYRKLDAQSDKSLIVKLLFKEISDVQQNGTILKYLLKRYASPEELTDKLWSIVKSGISSNKVKIFALDLLRDTDSQWNYDESCDYLENPDEFVDEDTKKLLENAILNPEVQIDFLDFINSLPDNDKIILLDSLGQDYSKDELANVLIPVFLSQPDSQTGKKALEILGNSKSALAYHALNTSMEIVPEHLKQAVKKNISTLKLAGIRNDNSVEFYREILKNSKPYKFCLTYPDGQGNTPIIMSRINNNGKVQFVAVVINDYYGIRDCFGFNEIAPFECNTIIEKFYQNEKQVDLSPEVIKFLLLQGELISHKNNNSKMSYEYICWKNILADIEPSDNDIEKTLKDNFVPRNISKDILTEINHYDFMCHWFLDENYSDEYEEFLEEIKKSSPENYDSVIDNHLLKIFYEKEYNIWAKRLLTTAYIKLKEELTSQAQNLYSLYNDEEMFAEFLRNILRTSIYQYFYKMRNENNDYNAIITQIEKIWVAADE